MKNEASASDIQEDPSRDHRDLAKGAFINTLGIGARTGKAVYIVLLPRLFGSEVFGLYILTWALIDVVSKIGSMGLEWGLLRTLVQLRAKGKADQIRYTIMRVTLVSISWSFVIAIALYGLSPWISSTLLQKDVLLKPLRMFSFGIPFATTLSVVVFSLRANRKMQYEVYIRSLIEPLILLGIGVTAYFFYPTIEGIILAHILSLFGALLAAFYFVHRVYPSPEVRPATHTIEWGKLIRYSLPMSGMDFLNNLKARLDVMVIGRFLPLTEVGIFGAITEIGNLIKKIRQAFEPIFMPIVSYLHEIRDRERLQKHFALAIRWIIIPGLGLLGPILLVPEVFLRVFENDFVVGSSALMIFSVGMFCYVTIGLSDSVLSMTGYAFTNLFNSILLVGINLGLHILLIPRYGLVGAAVATSITFVLISLVRLGQMMYFLKISPFSRSQLKPLMAGGIAFIIAEVLLQFVRGPGWMEVSILVGAFLLVYGIGLRALGFEEEDNEILHKMKIGFKKGLRKVFPQKDATSNPA